VNDNNRVPCTQAQNVPARSNFYSSVALSGLNGASLHERLKKLHFMNLRKQAADIGEKTAWCILAV